MKTTLLLALLLVGCSTAQVDKDLGEMNKQHNASLVPESAPYVYDDVFGAVYKRDFADKVCGLKGDKASWPQDKSDECLGKLQLAFQARIGETYPHANPDQVFAKCDAHPVECRDGHNFERWARENHNAAVEASRVRRGEQIKTWHHMKGLEEEEQRARAWTNAGKHATALSQSLAPQRPPATCISSPNVLGGMTMSCH